MSRAQQSPVLVVVAHPDDEALGFAGVIAAARAEGRRVCVAVVTNGDSEGHGRLPLRFCGAPRGRPSRVARQGVRRNRETIEAMGLLGLHWSGDPRSAEIVFLGYPNYGLEPIAASTSPWEGDQAGLHRTYAAGNGRGCNGDLRFLLEGRHSLLRAADLAADFDSLLGLVQPGDLYSHVEFDGHPDHAEVHRQVSAAVARRGRALTLHCTLIHPQGTGSRMYESALEWPNPDESSVRSPVDRFTPEADFDAPPADGRPEWGPLGPPDEVLEVPPPMREPDPTRNLKWQVISRYASQIDCRRRRDGTVHASCGYMRAFVKRSEFFWTRRFE